MGNKLITFFLFLCIACFSQAPQYLNYQGVARDATGNIISTTIGLKFEILQGSSSGTVVYDETNTSLPSSAGIFTTAIGSGAAGTGTFSAINWAGGPYYVRVSIDPAGGTSFTAVGTSQLLSVPYALYAEKSGGSSAMPTGTLTGQTLYWDNPGNKWVVDKNLLSDGQRVNVGDGVMQAGDKLKVSSYSLTDSSAILGYHVNTPANGSAIFGVAIGNAPNSGSLTLNPIMGGYFIGYNSNANGTALGSAGFGSSPNGDAIGVLAIGSSSSIVLGRSVGLYATGLGPTYINNYAAIFDRGRVLFNDTLIINTNGNIGDVLTRGINGKSHWQTPGGPWTKPTASVVTLTNNSDNVGIGTNSPGAKLHVLDNGSGASILGANTSVVSSAIAIGVQGTSQNTHSLSAGVYGLHSSNGVGVYAINTNSSSPTGSGMYGISLGTTTNNIGVKGEAANGSGIGVMGIAFGTGISVYGLKTNTAPSGNAGKFENQNPGNSSDAVLALNFGSGAAVHAMTGTLTTSALALLVENGHIRANGPSITVTSNSVTGGFTSVAGPVCTACNDVRGVVSFSTSATGFSPTNYAEVTITFAKPYSAVPNINLTPLTDLQGLSYVISNPASTGFSIRIYRSATMSNPSSIPNALFKFNYIVIE